MTTDYLGNPVTDASPATLQGVDDFIHGFLSYQNKAVNVLAAAEADPGNCMANAYAAMIWMFLEAPEAPDHAAPFIARARAAAATATTREKLNSDMVAAWAKGDIPGAIGLCERIADNFPTDLGIIKLGQYHLFNLGDMPGMLRMGLAALNGPEDQPYVHGMIAFGYEQCHLLTEAEAHARRALEIEPTDPWAHHALAHVMLTQSRADEGIAFLESVAPTWAELNSFMRSHNWWHLALFYISRGRTADVLKSYDAHVWGISRTYSQDQVGATSLLARMEFAGIDPGDRWQDVADHVARRGADTVNPFLTLQYLYALARMDRPETAALMTAIETRAETPTHDQTAWAEVALPAARAILAHARGDHATAIRLMGQALPRMAETGGSHAQRDLFEQIHLDSLLRAGRTSTAQQVLEMRRTFDHDGVPVNIALAQVYAQAGLPFEAAKARARAQATLQRATGA
ncbi:MAG: tetratricopeptide repeat protein [Rhodobacterales bacterium]|nr:tetratricopeptide repeat protein [Rhodobacterales bacterium]